MWNSLTTIIQSRPSLHGKYENLKEFSLKNKTRFSILDGLDGDDIRGLFTPVKNDIFISNFYLNDLLNAFKQYASQSY